jgi:ABC-type transport system involved in multi-copper enzyme maturation permease subunit
MLAPIRSSCLSLGRKVVHFFSSHTWREHLLLACLLLTALTLWLSRSSLPTILQVAAWAALLLTLAVTIRRGWLRFFGPVFFHDIIRSARRSNFALLRGVYAGALLAMLFLVYSNSVSITRTGSYWDMLWSPASANRQALATFGNLFFGYFSGVQIVAVLLMTPLCAAGAITEEKERRTLEFMLATDLTDREIILGKLAARMAYLVLFVLTGLPIVSILQFLGGLDPDRVLAGFVMTAMTMLSLTGVSVAVSVSVKRTRSAVLFTYFVMGGFLLFSSCCFAVPVGFITAGNPFVAGLRLFGQPNGTLFQGHVLAIMTEYCLVHCVLTIICYYTAAASLRSTSVSYQESMAGVDILPVSRSDPRFPPQPQPGAVDSWGAWEPSLALAARYRESEDPQLDPPPKPRPPVMKDPILWKELYVEPLMRLGPGGQTVIMVFGIMLLLTAGYILLIGLAAAASTGNIAAFANTMARYLGILLTCILLLIVLLRSAGTMTSERDRQTLDGLLTSCLDNKELLWGKWLGSILCVRLGWWFLGSIWVLAVLAGGLHIVALPLLVVAWLAYAAFIAGLGVLISLLTRSTIVATLATVLVTAACCGGHRGIWFLMQEMWYPKRLPEGIGDFLLYALTPPVSMAILSFQPGEINSGQYLHLTDIMFVFASAGIVCYGVSAFALWRLVLRLFGPVTGRMPLPRARVPQAPKVP